MIQSPQCTTKCTAQDPFGTMAEVPEKIGTGNRPTWSDPGKPKTGTLKHPVDSAEPTRKPQTKGLRSTLRQNEVFSGDSVPSTEPTRGGTHPSGAYSFPSSRCKGQNRHATSGITRRHPISEVATDRIFRNRRPNFRPRWDTTTHLIELLVRGISTVPTGTVKGLL